MRQGDERAVRHHRHGVLCNLVDVCDSGVEACCCLSQHPLDSPLSPPTPVEQHQDIWTTSKIVHKGTWRIQVSHSCLKKPEPKLSVRWSRHTRSPWTGIVHLISLCMQSPTRYVNSAYTQHLKAYVCHLTVLTCFAAAPCWPKSLMSRDPDTKILAHMCYVCCVWGVAGTQLRNCQALIHH
jgi:hypothetical protein